MLFTSQSMTSKQRAHMATRWFLWFYLRACGTHIHDCLTLRIECKCRTMMITVHHISSIRVHWPRSLWINVFTRSSSNPEGLSERRVSLMSKRSSLKRENHFLAVLFTNGIVPIYGANVSGRLRCFRPSIELRRICPKCSQFLHLAFHFLASTTPLTVFKWQNFNM